jgi:hypothetical protein
VSVGCTVVLASQAWAVTKPDFDDHEAVVASLNALIEQCGEDAACLEACNEAAESMSKFTGAHARNRSLRRNRWNACLKKQPAAAVAAPAAPRREPEPVAANFDPSRIVIADLRLGGKLDDASDRISLMDADGYYIEEKRERGSGGIRWNDMAARGDMPDIVKNYEARITDKTQRVYIFLEAAGDGTIYKIDFKQKGGIDPKAARQAVIDRFGTPTKTTSSYLYWGCKDGQLDVCVKATASEYVFEIFAQDVRIKDNWRRAYEDKVREAKGAKKGLQF